MAQVIHFQAEKSLSDISVHAPSDLSTSQLTPQAIFRRNSWRPKSFSNVSVDAERDSFFGWDSRKRRLPSWRLREIFRWPSQRCKRIFQRLSRRPQKTSWKRPLMSQLTPQAIFRRLSRRPKESSDMPVCAGKNRTAADILNIYKNLKSDYEDESF